MDRENVPASFEIAETRWPGEQRLGTTISVYLPCTDVQIANKEPPAKTSDHPQRPSVLIVDDSAEVAEVTSALFEQLGYATIYRDSAEEALSLLADGAKIDLVFSDARSNRRGRARARNPVALSQSPGRPHDWVQ